MRLSSLIFSFFKALYSLGLLLILDWRFNQSTFDQYVVFISLVFLSGSITNLNLMYSTQIHYASTDDIKKYAGIFTYRLIITLITVMILSLLGYSNIVLLFFAISSKAIGDILIGYFRNKLQFYYGSLLIFIQIMLTLVSVFILHETSSFNRILFFLILAELIPALFVIFWLIKISKTDWLWDIREIILTGLITIPFTLILPLVSNLRTQQLYNFASIENAVNYSLSFKISTPVMLACGMVLNYSIQSFKKEATWREFKIRLRDLFIIGILAIFLLITLVTVLNTVEFDWWEQLSFSRVSYKNFILSSFILVVLALSTFLNQTLTFLNSSMEKFILQYSVVLVVIVFSIFLIKNNLTFGITVLLTIISSFILGCGLVKKILN